MYSLYKIRTFNNHCSDMLCRHVVQYKNFNYFIFCLKFSIIKFTIFDIRVRSCGNSQLDSLSLIGYKNMHAYRAFVIIISLNDTALQVELGIN